jgi:HSP20 family molecular chaperone IbpA
MTRSYNDLFSLFDEIFSDSTRFFRLVENHTQPQRFNKLVSSSQFPPANILCDTKTKELKIQVALAGYSENDISLSFDGDYLRLLVDRSDGDKNLSEGEEITEYVMQRGIKLPQRVEASWIIDPRYYSRENVQVSFKDGLLTIIISPRDEIKPVNIKLFGKLSEKPEVAKITE